MSASKTVIINNRDGIHARPSAIIVEQASKYSCDIFFYKNGQKGSAKNILDLMSNALAYGKEIKIECIGENEKEALKIMAELFEREYNFKKGDQ